MKKRKLLVLVTILGVCTLTSCGNPGVTAPSIEPPISDTTNNRPSNEPTNSKPSAGDTSQNKITGIDLIGDVKKYYGLGSEIDLSLLSVLVNYSDGTTNKISLYDSSISYDTFDTSTIGLHEVTIKYLTFETKFTYEVKQFKVTLKCMDGTLDGNNEYIIDVNKNTASLDGIIPTANDLDMHFAGWFYDEELTKRFSSKIGSDITVEDDLTLYAGYDVDYSNKYSYTVNSDGTATLDKLYCGEDEWLESIYIPATIDLYPVSKVGDDFLSEIDEFFLFDVWSVEIEPNENLKVIGDRAFNNLFFVMEVSLPDSVERIGEQAFYNCGLLSLTLPKKLKMIGDEAFAYNSELEEIDFNDSDLISIGDEAFSNCVKLNGVELSSKVEIIGSGAFSGCKNFVSFNIPASVDSIGINVFSGFPNLLSIDVDENNKKFKSIDGNLYSKDGTIFYRYCLGKDDETFTLPNGVKIIYESAFDNTRENIALKTLVMPETLIEIGDYAFSHTSIDFILPASLERIGQKAFYGYKTESFKVNENNKKYKVVNSSLVSIDGKTLYAIPEGYSEDNYTLDDNVEVIQSYSFDSLDISNFIIGKNSKLKKIEPYGLPLLNCSKLVSLYIEKPDVFEIYNKSFESSFTYGFSIIVKDENLDKYKNSWSSLELNEKINIYDTNEYTALIAEKVNNDFTISSLDAFKAFDAFSNDIDFKSDFNRIINIMANLKTIYMFGASVDEKSLKYTIKFADLFARSADEYYSPLTNAERAGSAEFSKFYNSITTLPQSVLSKLDLTHLNQINAEYSEFIKEREACLKDIVAYKYDKKNFDKTQLIDLMTRCEDYSVETMIISSDNDRTKVYTFRCAYDIYMFTCGLDYTVENFTLLYTLYYGNNKDIYGINNYMTYVIPDDVKDNIYGYDALETCLTKLEALGNSLTESLRSSLSVIDAEVFKRDDYEKIFNILDLLDYNYSYIGDLIENVRHATLRVLINDFISMCNEDIDSNLADLTSTLFSINTYFIDDGVYENETEASKAYREFAQKLAEYPTYKTCLNRFNEKYNEAKEGLDNYYKNASYDDEESFKNVNNYYHENKDFADILDDSSLGVKYRLAYKAVFTAYMIKLALEEPLTKENYDAIFHLVYDGEDGIDYYLSNYYKEDSLNRYQVFIETFNSLITNEVLDAYNKLVASL